MESNTVEPNTDLLKLLCEYFPMAVFTGTALVFISDEHRVELTQHRQADFSRQTGGLGIIRVRIFKKALSGEFLPGHYEDFQLPTLQELAMQIERYIQFAVGKNIRENI